MFSGHRILKRVTSTTDHQAKIQKRFNKSTERYAKKLFRQAKRELAKAEIGEECGIIVSDLRKQWKWEKVGSSYNYHDVAADKLIDMLWNRYCVVCKKNKPMLGSDVYVRMHLQRCTVKDEVFGLATVPLEFNKDGTPIKESDDENH